MGCPRLHYREGQGHETTTEGPTRLDDCGKCCTESGVQQVSQHFLVSEKQDLPVRIERLLFK